VNDTERTYLLEQNLLNLRTPVYPTGYAYERHWHV